MVETNMKRLQTVPTSLPPPPPESIIGNIPWMNKDETLINFFKVILRTITVVQLGVRCLNTASFLTETYVLVDDTQTYKNICFVH